MGDYLDIFKKFTDMKDMADLCDEVQKLRYYYQTQQFREMQKHINSLVSKYALESLVWNAVNPDPPQTYDQAYANAENFLCAQGVKIIVDKITDFRSRLTNDEISFIESMFKTTE